MMSLVNRTEKLGLHSAIRAPNCIYENHKCGYGYFMRYMACWIRFEAGVERILDRMAWWSSIIALVSYKYPSVYVTSLMIACPVPRPFDRVYAPFVGLR